MNKSCSPTSQILAELGNGGGEAPDIAAVLGLPDQQVTKLLADMFQKKRVDRVLMPASGLGHATPFFYFLPGCRPAWLGVRKTHHERKGSGKVAGGLICRQMKWEIA